jgi:hypothetical protein
MHTLNGNGEVSGSYQIKDWGYTNTVRSSSAKSHYLKFISIASRFNQFRQLWDRVSYHLAMDSQASA